MEQRIKVKRYKTQSVRKGDFTKQWLLIDATDKVVGRLASNIAILLRGKHRPHYTPHVDCGDYVIVTNASKVRFLGKKEEQKTYLSYSGYPGGQKQTTPKVLREKNPTKILSKATQRMLPKNKLGRALFRNLFLYEGPDHPHIAQKPIDVN